MQSPVIPEYIVVHLGAPDQAANDVRVEYIDYIKNVASSEIYPTWPEAALRANILAINSVTLNRLYTEFYRSQGYEFDITNNTAYDQSFVPGREIFGNISEIVDDIFNDYIVRQGFVQPLYALYCNGTTTTCEGLSQWGTVTLADQGLTPYEILQRYYGDDIAIVFNAPIGGDPISSYPGTPLRLGDIGEDVREIQEQLNRIAQNYPAIPTIPQENGVFGVQTESAVRAFQEIFDLVVDGIVGRATWYRIRSIYNAVRRLAELIAEGITPEELEPLYFEQSLGSSGNQVRNLQYYLAVISYFDDDIPYTYITGVFDEAMEATIRAIQEKYGLPVTGELDRATWRQIVQIYADILKSLPEDAQTLRNEIYPGRVLTEGIEGDDVRKLQELLNRAAERNPSIPEVQVSGVFDPQTFEAVIQAQILSGEIADGIVGSATWYQIVKLAGGGVEPSTLQNEGGSGSA